MTKEANAMTPLRPINPGEATGNGRELVRAVEARRHFTPNGVIRALIYTRLALLVCSAMFLFASTCPGQKPRLLAPTELTAHFSPLIR
jgi:hypothetical protein